MSNEIGSLKPGEDEADAKTVKAETPAEPRYHSHVLYFPKQKPFDNTELRWRTFIGEFVAPIIANHPALQYWFSYYTVMARFRILTADYEKIRPQLEALRNKLRLVDKGEEKEQTLAGDLGGPRFCGPNSKVSPPARAESILKALTAASNLTVESVIRRADGYWEFEANGDVLQNPVSGNRFGVCHLFHNLMDSKGRVFAFHDARGFDGVLSYIYYRNALQQGQIAPVSVQHHDILM